MSHAALLCREPVGTCMDILEGEHDPLDILVGSLEHDI